MSNMVRQLLHYKFCQIIPVCNKNKHWFLLSSRQNVNKNAKMKWKQWLFQLLRFSDNLSDVIIDNPYLTLQKDSANVLKLKTQMSCSPDVASKISNSTFRQYF